jgi:hypothetical protein
MNRPGTDSAMSRAGWVCDALVAVPVHAAEDLGDVLGGDAVEVQVYLAGALSACLLPRPGRSWRGPVVRVAAVRPGAVHRPGREDAPFVDLAAQRADDRKAG